MNQHDTTVFNGNLTLKLRHYVSS